ncbi:MAG TPA: dTMP kinase [Bacilli bacterium]
MKGLFITFEGPDGAGKTTQLNLLAARLRGDGLDVVTTREPGGTPIGDQIRGILLSPENREMAARTEALLYAASRAQHVQEKIIPALHRGSIVLCDRFVDASIAYQSAGLGIDEQWVRTINAYAVAGMAPHRTYLLDIAEAASRRRLLDRAGQALDRIELREEAYHRKVRRKFLQIAKEESDRVMMVNANRAEEEIAAEIYQDFQKLLRALSN